MATNRTTTNANRNGISPETARRILSEGKMTLGGKNVYVFNNTLSDLPPIKNEGLADKDFVIHRLSGEVTTEYGEAWIFEVGSTIAEATRSWLVGKPQGRPNDSITGRNLKRHFDRNGVDAFPIFVHLAYHDEGRGNAYYALEAPHGLRDRAEEVDSEQPVSPALPSTSQQPADFSQQVKREVEQARVEVSSGDDYDDLPF